jgi:hypothetical protein
MTPGGNDRLQDNDAGTWLPSRCLAMDARSNSDIPALGGTPQYKHVLRRDIKTNGF